MTRWIEIWAVCVLYTALVAPPAAASTAPSFPERKAENAAYHRAPHIEVALIANVRTIVPGKPFRLGIHQRIETHWHTYWKNPGDSGLAPTARWSAPPSITVDPLRWPTPRRIRVKHLANYGYESDVLLIAPARVAPSLEGSDVTLQVEFSWLVCREECIPGKANLTLRLPIARGDRPPTPANTALFATFHDRMPRDASGIGTKLFERGERLELVVDRLPLMTGERVIAFLPATPEVVHNAEKERIKLDKGILRVDLAKNEYFQRPRGSVEGVLVAQLGTRRTGWRVFATFVGTPPGTQTPNGKTPNGKTPNGKTPNGKTPSSIDQTRPAKAPSIDRDPKRGGDGPAIRELFRGWQPFGGVETKQSPWIELLQTILFALIAGVMLNLMPCVFPVLSIKVMHIVEQAGGERRRIRDHGLVFLAGVLTTFSVLAVMLLVFRAAGSRIGWGFQLQEPAVVFALAAVLFGVGLNLSGLFEVGETVMGVGQSHAQKGGFAGSFASGVLAVVVATPCSAPFMGAAIAYALTQPWWTTLAVFNALGIGMALPYLVLSLSPALLRRLPRPGAWMVRFKQLLAFPMYGAAAWLLWVLGSQAGRTGMLTAVIALIGLAFAGWLFGTTRSVERRRWIASSAALALSVVALYWGAITVRADSTRYRSERRESPSIVSTSGTRPPRSTGDSLPTLRYSPRALAALLARKQLVFLNMTADWCISCKVNERVALKRDVVQRALRTRGVRYMVGDWTSRDAAITEVLDHFKRNGVPLYLMLQPSTKRYMILPQVLTPSMVVEAVHKL